MALLAYASTEETTNANRVCRLLLGPCTDQLRDLLRHHVPTSTFPSVINHHRYKLPRLTPPQRNLILPITGCYLGNYDDMDISLLYILLRNICGIPPHINGWGYDPVPTDRTTSANIERIRSNRNQCVHSTNPTLSNADFNLIWSSIRSAVVEIDNYLSNGNRYEKEVDLLRHETMDPVRDKHYRDELDRQTKEDQATRDTVNELKRKCSTEQKEVQIKIQKIDNEISSMKSNSFPQNLRDHTRKEIEQHTRENTFVEIEAVSKYIAIHADKDVFLITGRPGIGKSKNGLDLLRHLGEKHPTYDVIKISDLHLVERILNKDSRMILLLEDVFGKTNCKYSEDNDKSVLDVLQAYINSGNVKVIFTIRSVVKKSLQYLYLFSSHGIFKGLEEVDLDSSQFKMSVVEKKRLLLNYCSISNIRIVNAWENENYNDETILDKNVPVRFSEATLINIVNIETYLGFPESCYMFTTNRALTRLGIQFFKHPSRFLNQEIDCLRKNGENSKKERICYITLVYILLSSNTLMINDFDERKVASILKSCYNREGFILKSDIVDAADEMTGSYLTYNAEISVFQFQHQTIFESIMLSYYKVDPILVLTTIDFEMIREIVKLCNYHAKKEEIRMIVPKELYGDLARRLCLIFSDQFSHMPSNFIKVICDSDLMTEIDADFINQLGEHFMEASNYNISTIITYDGKSEEVVFCLLAALLWYSTIKDWKTEDIKVILHSLKTMLLSETRSNVKTACKRTIVAAFLYLCENKNTNDIIKFFLQLIHELRISFDINKCFQGVVDKQNQPVASCILQHFSKKLDIVEVILETEREKLQDLINIFSVSFACSTVGSLIHDRARLIKWIFSSVDSKHFNMTKAVETAGNKRLFNIVDWFLEKFNYELFDCQFLLKEACGKGWKNVVSRFLQEGTYQSFDLRCIMSAACQHSWHTIVKQLLQNSTLVTFDVIVLLTDACKKDDFEIVKSLIVYIEDKNCNSNDDIKYVFEALRSNQSWSMSDFCTNFVKVLLKDIDSNQKVIQNENLESLHAINLLLNKVSETTFNFYSAVAESISNDVIHKENVLQLFMDRNNIKKIHVSLLLLEACREVNCKFVTWLLKNIDNELLKVTTSFNESCRYGRLQIIKIMIQYADHKLLNFSSAFLGSVKEEWRQHHEKNEEVMKFLLNTIDHSLFDFNIIAKEIISLEQEDVMKILLNKVDIRSFITQQVVDYACEQGLLEILEIFWKGEKKEQKDIFSVVSRALKGSKLDIVNWFRAFNKACKVGNLQLVIWILDNLDQSASLDIVKCILDKEDHNLIDLKKVLNELYEYCHKYRNEHILLLFKMIVKDVDWKLLDMKTVMNVACKLENLDTVECVLDKADHTLLDMKSAMIGASEAGNTDIVKCILHRVNHNLIDVKAVISNLYKYSQNYKNERTLCALKVLVENVDWKLLDMKTVMNLACALDSLDIVECILDKVDHKLLDMNSAMMRACGADMNSAMMRACGAGNAEIVKYILDKVDHKFLDMNSAMMRACGPGNAEIVKYILDTVDHKLLDMNSAMMRACGAGNAEIVKYILDKVDHKLLDINSVMMRACGARNAEIVKCILDKVDHNLIDFKDVLYEIYKYEGESNQHVFKVIVENVDWKQLDMMRVMNLACAFDRLDIVEFVLDKVDHKLLDINSAIIHALEAGNIDIVTCILDKVDHNLIDLSSFMTRACEAGEEGNTDIVKGILDKVDHNLIDFKAVISELYEYYPNDSIECILCVLKVILENVSWKQLDMKTVMNVACTLDRLDIVECILEKEDHTLLDINSAMIHALEVGNIDIVKCVLDNVDHNLIAFKDVTSNLYEYRHNYNNESILCVLKVLVKNVDWKQLDMKTVMNLACTLDSLDIVECILDKVDHTLLDMNGVMTRASKEGNIDIVKCVLDKVDHNLIDFKDVTSKLYEYCHNYKNEHSLRVLEVLVENVDWKQLDMKTVMNLACKLNCLDIVECILDKVDHTLLDMNSAVMRACEAGNTDIVKYILFIVKYLCNNVNKITLNMKVAFNETCRYGNHELVIWILENVDQSQLDIKTAMLKACRGPNDETVKLLNQRFGENMFDIKSSMNNACRYGNLAVIRWLWSKTDKQHVCDTKSALINACLSGKEENVKWLVKNIDQSQFDIQASITETFVNGINVMNIVKTLLNYSDRSSVNMNTVVVEACAIGNMTLVKWLLETDERHLVDINQALYSVLNVHSKISENDNVYKKSVTREKRSLVMWVLEKYSPSLFDMNNTVKEICRNGWTEVLQWIRGNSQDHSLEIGPAINVACVNGHKELVEWALSNIDVKSLDTETLMNESCGNGLLTLAKWMWENIEHSKLDMRTAMNEACSYSRIETAQWILENVDANLLDTGNVLNEASKHGWLSVVKDLLKNAQLSQDDIRSTIIEACMNGHLDIVEYMFTKFGKDICDIESILPGLCSKSVNKEVAKFLISQFKNQLCLFTNVMPHACGFGWTEVVEMLLQDTDHTEIVMKDSLLNACRQGEVDVVKIIFSKVDHTQIDIAEAFIVVCTRGWEEITEFLLDEIDHTAFDMKSALTEASRSGEEDIVELLFQKVKPEKFDIQMAIDAASQNHMHENIVYQLLQRNCDAKFEQDRLKKKAEEHDWPKVLSIIRKYSKRK